MAAGDIKDNNKLAAVIEFVRSGVAHYARAVWIVGETASGAADSTNPIKTGARYNTSPSQVDSGDLVDNQADSYGHLKKTGGYAVKTVTIPQGGERSSVLDLEGFKEIAIQMPSAWTSANLNVQAYSTNTPASMLNVYNSDGSQLVISVAADRVVSLTEAEAKLVAPLRFIRFFATATQPAARTLTVFLKS